MSTILTLIEASPVLAEGLLEAFSALACYESLPDEIEEIVVEFARWIVNFRTLFEEGAHLHANNHDYYSSLLLEACQQAYYSILPEQAIYRIPSGWPLLIKKLSSKLEKDQ